MNMRKLTPFTLGLATLLAIVVPSAHAQISPFPGEVSDEAISLIPSIEVVDFCGEGLFDITASCGSGLTAQSFVTFSDVTPPPGIGFCFGSEFSEQGISCQIEEDGTVSWTLQSGEGTPDAINSVILERCDFGEPNVRGVFSYLYEPPPFGATTDSNLSMFLPDIEIGFQQVVPTFVTFCFNQQEIVGTPATSQVPVCPPDAGVCGQNPMSDNSYLVEVTQLRDDDGEVVQPSTALDEDTCVCSTDTVTQCDPAAGEGEPNACRDPGEGGAGNVVRLFQHSSDPYFCTTLNGRRVCWAY